MKILLLSLFIILISISAYAYDIFSDRELNTLQVIMIDIDAGRAWIQDAEGNETEVLIGDTIGVEKGVVIKIDEASITVEMGNTRTKMPVVYGFE